jgi:hypothetical protein
LGHDLPLVEFDMWLPADPNANALSVAAVLRRCLLVLTFCLLGSHTIAADQSTSNAQAAGLIVRFELPDKLGLAEQAAQLRNAGAI